MSRRVVWSPEAKASLDAHCNYIAKDFPSSSKKVRAKIIKTAKALVSNPEMYQVDEYYPKIQETFGGFFVGATGLYTKSSNQEY